MMTKRQQKEQELETNNSNTAIVTAQLLEEQVRKMKILETRIRAGNDRVEKTEENNNNNSNRDTNNDSNNDSNNNSNNNHSKTKQHENENNNDGRKGKDSETKQHETTMIAKRAEIVIRMRMTMIKVT